MRFASFLKSLRIDNFVLILLFHIIIYFKFFAHIPPLTFGLLTLAVLLILTGGNLENDLKDRIPDLLNRKPNFFFHRNKNTVRHLPYWFYVAGLLFAFIFLQKINKPQWIWYFLSVVILLINYNTALKKMPVIGNFVISLVTMLPVLQLIAFFDLSASNQAILILLALLIFTTNMNREIIKDILDRKGDRIAGYQTLGILSVRKALQLVFIHSGIAVIVSIFLVSHLDKLPGKIFYSLVTALLIYTSLYLLKGKKSLARLKKTYKWIILLGIIGISVM